MQYFVVSPDGNKYGPADVATLNQWIAENRLNPGSVLEDASTGQRLTAVQVEGLQFPGAANPVAPPRVREPVGSSPDWSTPPSMNAGSPYPRGYGLDPVASAAEARRGWNWGAFFFSWVWGLNHKAYLTLITLGIGVLSFPVSMASRNAGAGGANLVLNIVGLALAIWYGMKGNEWAWASGRFQTVAEMRACQRIWALWALGLFLVGCVFGVLLAVLLPAMVLSTRQ